MLDTRNNAGFQVALESKFHVHFISNNVNVSFLDK